MNYQTQCPEIKIDPPIYKPTFEEWLEEQKEGLQEEYLINHEEDFLEWAREEYEDEF